MAEGEGFEPPKPCGSPVFKTSAFNLSAIPPKEIRRYYTRFHGCVPDEIFIPGNGKRAAYSNASVTGPKRPEGSNASPGL